MTRALIVVAMTTVALLLSMGTALAHPLTPPGEANGEPALGGGAVPGHNGVECAAVQSPDGTAFDESLSAFECKAASVPDAD